jgi:multisubunit Na+/H+ antiporter MnhG subunit
MILQLHPQIQQEVQLSLGWLVVLIAAIRLTGAVTAHFVARAAVNQRNPSGR